MQSSEIDGPTPTRQESTLSTTPMLIQSVSTEEKPPLTSIDQSDLTKDQSTDVLTTTVIPIREEFRCRRSWFFYHDIRAFTTSWMPPPVFLFWKLFVAIYIFAWLIAHIVARDDEFGPRWLIYLTDLAYLVLTAGTTAMAILCIGYTIVHYTSPTKLVAYFPKMDHPIQKVYRQDNIPWYVKICWAVYIVGASLAPLVTAGYWILVYRPNCPITDSELGMNATNFSGTPATAATIACTNDIDVYTVHLHGVNAIIVIFDLSVSRIPYQFMHFFYPLFFQIPYVIFTVIYWGAGGTNPGNEMAYIYSSLDYGGSSIAGGWAVMLVLAPMPVFLLMFLLAWLRDVISKHVPCCYRDIREQAFEVNINTNGSQQNGEAETTVL